MYIQVIYTIRRAYGNEDLKSLIGTLFARNVERTKLMLKKTMTDT